MADERLGFIGPLTEANQDRCPLCGLDPTDETIHAQWCVTVTDNLCGVMDHRGICLKKHDPRDADWRTSHEWVALADLAIRGGAMTPDQPPAPRQDGACECPPCPGRGNDGHGHTHCAECCFGTLVIPDLDCPTHGQPRQDEQAAGGVAEEPNEVGWYAYSGGRQTMVFHLRETGQWSAHFDNGTAHDCAWGYIEQALSVWNLVPLAAHRDAAEERVTAAEALHRDLVSRLGFGDNITEPMADNDTIVAWFEERGREADEWRESQHWRNDCYAKGHPDDDDCYECDPTLRLLAAEAERAALVERVRSSVTPVFVAAEKVRTEARRSGDIAASLLRSEDEAARKAGHDLLHHLNRIVGWCNAHGAAGKSFRAALAATTDRPER